MPIVKEHPLYGVWGKMRGRCNNSNAPDYPRYGGKGITVCKQWDRTHGGFQAFVEDMGDRPEGMTLDRIDSSKGYYKENCRWADYYTQNTNRSNVQLHTHDGLTMTLSAWSRHLGVGKSTLSMRYYVYGWPIEKVLTTKVGK